MTFSLGFLKVLHELSDLGIESVPYPSSLSKLTGVWTLKVFTGVQNTSVTVGAVCEICKLHPNMHFACLQQHALKQPDTKKLLL